MTILNGFKDKTAKLCDISSHIKVLPKLNLMKDRCERILKVEYSLNMPIGTVKLTPPPGQRNRFFGAAVLAKASCLAHKPLVNYKVDNNTTLVCHFFKQRNAKVRALNLNNFYGIPLT
jgi:hypothetical protein